MILHVDHKFRRGGESFLAKAARELDWCLSYRMILSDMITKAVYPGECLVTQLTGEILFKNFILLKMSPPVFLQILLLGKYLAALLALIFLTWSGLLVSPVTLS